MSRPATRQPRTSPLAGQDWTGTKAAHRFLSNVQVNEDDIPTDHFCATRDLFADLFAGCAGNIFVLHDTTEFSLQREDCETIGITFNVNGGREPRRTERLVPITMF